ncbi:carbamoyltransferase [Gemmatimonadetes bacterium T265]|nr:carbamoyltransferase [Gemmatimonadetes bacterium T265]
MPPARHVLGLSAYYHDAAACLLRDGEVVAAAQEERFTRLKGDAAFPARAAAYCLAEGGVGVGDLAAVAFYDKPLLKFERLLETYLAVAPRGFGSFLKAGPLWVKEKLFTDRTLRRALGELAGRAGAYEGDLLYAEHHESHAASAFYPSPFDEAAVLTVDGVGEWATASVGAGRGSGLELLSELRFPDSLGLLYSAFTYYLGFRVNSGEYKVMGLAPYGEPRYADLILTRLMDLREDGSFTLDRRYFGYVSGLRMTTGAFDDLFGGPPRTPERALDRRHFDLARSVQHVCEEVVLRMARTAHRLAGLDRLCMAGGVALNCVANARVLREGPFRDVWVQPAAGDAGGALGAAALAWHRALGGARRVARGAGGAPRDGMGGTYLGPAFADADVAAALDAVGAVYEVFDAASLAGYAADRLAEGAVVGWFQGRMEYGPRALGNRSILADPRRPDIQSRLNRAIKFRESFRPFAPSVTAEHAGKWFVLDRDSPYMLFTADVRPARRGALPAVTHVDGSARVQTVRPEDNPAFHALLLAFAARTGCPMLVNTSFNVRGEPVVCTPADALRCFRDTRMDVLVLGPFVLERAAQRGWAARDAASAVPAALAFD